MPLAEPLHCFAVTTPGLEPILDRELRDLGLALVGSERGGIEFTATRAQLAVALLWSRTANRITVRLAEFPSRTFGELERYAASVDWTRILAPGGAVHFRVTSKKSRLYHQDAIAERLQRVVANVVPSLRGVAAPSDAEQLESDVARVPDVQRVIVRVLRDQVTVSADASGALLHMRGYRQATAKAPMRETLAAALLLACGWSASDPLLDPLCGSGTIPIEAAWIARRIAPGRLRRFAAERWPGVGDVFSQARLAAAADELGRGSAPVSGSDRDAGAIRAAISNAERAGVAADIDFTQAPISAVSPSDDAGWLVTNPPYGSRVGERHALRDLYATLGRVARARRPRWTLALLSGDRMLDGQVGPGGAEFLRTTNGGIPVRGVRY